MAEVSLAVELRSERGKGTNRRLRVAGRIPGVVYGGALSSVPISLDPVQLDHLIRTSHAGVNTLIDLTGPSEVAGRTVLVKELQREPVRGALLHADLYEVDQNVRIRVSVPIHLRGSAPGVLMGGLIDHALRVVELDCLPRAIPDEILVDVSALGIGDSIHVRDLGLPEGVELHSQGDLPVVSVVSPKLEEEPVAAEAAAAVEPGLVGAAGEAAGGEESKES
jgi:large subunit ribosomal protein L25